MVAYGNTILPTIAPRPQDIVIRKAKPSVFFGTLLNAYLVDLQVDTIIATGGVTSGCIRSTVVDGFSYNYRLAVVEECTFDRGEASHAVGLFDLQSKYADVVRLDERAGGARALRRRGRTLARARRDDPRRLLRYRTGARALARDALRGRRLRARSDGR